MNLKGQPSYYDYTFNRLNLRHVVIVYIVNTNGTVQLPPTTFREWQTPQANDSEIKF